MCTGCWDDRRACWTCFRIRLYSVILSSLFAGRRGTLEVLSQKPPPGSKTPSSTTTADTRGPAKTREPLVYFAQGAVPAPERLVPVARGRMIVPGQLAVG